MYTSRGFNSSELGDVDVIFHDGLYHLFHLVLPNHDYIAHAVSRDGLLWRRVRNALFIGEPGEWDDDMLWTMHVSPDPDGPASWRMFYTGLSRKEGGRIQRIGLARSPDLFHWEKVRSSRYPLEISGPNYEGSTDEGRHWVSCRDPFFFRDGDERLLLVDARIPTGPIARRGCVGLAREVQPDCFEWETPLFHPGMYDDVEVPVVFSTENRYYLVGNLREDIKVHYWSSPELRGPYESFADNVLLPKGNYAVRVIPREGGGYLLWNFYISGPGNAGGRILPPPAELVVKEDGSLSLTSYSGFDGYIQKSIPMKNLLPTVPVLGNPTAASESTDGTLVVSSFSGYEVYHLNKGAHDFRLNCRIHLDGLGKMGMVLRSDEDAGGYYVSLDLLNGFIQVRYWITRENAHMEEAFQYIELQENHFPIKADRTHQITALAWGGYLEVSVDDQIAIRLVDLRPTNYSGIGFYVESAVLEVSQIRLDVLNGPEEEDHQLL